MTIVTQLLPDKKPSKQQEPLVQQDEQAQVTRDPEDGSSVVVTLRSSARRINTTTTLCVFIMALLVLSTGVIGGVYLYKSFSKHPNEFGSSSDGLGARGSDSRTKYQLGGESLQMKSSEPDYKPRHYRDWCRVSYIPELSEIQHGVTSRKGLEKSHHAPLTHKEMPDTDAILKRRFFEEEFDLDIEFDQYERIQVPDFSHGRRGRFIHDFSVNKTGIIDLKEQRCFVMPLNRTTVLPPQSLFDLVVKMKSNYYDVDTEVVRETMRVVMPPVTDFKTIGYYIAQECSTFPTYNLEKISRPVFKRSLDEESKKLFVEFAGNKITEFNIVNLQEAAGVQKPSK